MGLDFIKHESAVDRHPLLSLSAEDLDLACRFVIHSGSIKDLAATYDVSYPTMRQRLDRVIKRLQGVMAGRKPDALSELLGDMVERGELSTGAALAIREAARRAAAARATPPPTGGQP